MIIQGKSYRNWSEWSILSEKWQLKWCWSLKTTRSFCQKLVWQKIAVAVIMKCTSFKFLLLMALVPYWPHPRDHMFYIVLIFFCFSFLDLILYVTVSNCSVLLGRVFLGWTSIKQGLKCFAQGHNAVTRVRLEPTALWSRVKCSTTKPLGSPVNSKSHKFKVLGTRY